MSVRGKEFPSLVHEAGLGYKLQIPVPGVDGRERQVSIPPPANVVVEDTDVWPPWCFQLLLVASEYIAALHEFMTWSFPDDWAPLKIHVADLARQFIRTSAPVSRPAWLDCRAHRAWAAFTHCYFHGLRRPADNDSSQERREATRWLHRLVGERGWAEEGPVFSTAERWVRATLGRLQVLFPEAAGQTAVEWASAGLQGGAVLRPVATRGGKNVNGRYVPVYPFHVTGTWSENRFKLTLRNNAAPRSLKASCGLPTKFGQTNNCALGFLLLSDVSVAFTAALDEACRTWLTGEDRQKRLIQDFYDTVLSSDTAALNGDYTAYGYPSYLVACVLGWKLALEQLRRWLQAAAGSAELAGLDLAPGSQLELLIPRDMPPEQLPQEHLPPEQLQLPMQAQQQQLLQQQQEQQQQQQPQQQLVLQQLIPYLSFAEGIHQWQQAQQAQQQQQQASPQPPSPSPPTPGLPQPPSPLPPPPPQQAHHFAQCPWSAMSDPVGAATDAADVVPSRPDTALQGPLLSAASGASANSLGAASGGSAGAISVSPFVAMQQQQQQRASGIQQQPLPPPPCSAPASFSGPGLGSAPRTKPSDPRVAHVAPAQAMTAPAALEALQQLQPSQLPAVGNVLMPPPPARQPVVSATNGAALEGDVTGGLSNMSLDGSMLAFGDETLRLIDEDVQARHEPEGALPAPPLKPLGGGGMRAGGLGGGAAAALAGLTAGALGQGVTAEALPGTGLPSYHPAGSPLLPPAAADMAVPARTVTTVLPSPPVQHFAQPPAGPLNLPAPVAIPAPSLGAGPGAGSGGGDAHGVGAGAAHAVALLQAGAAALRELLAAAGATAASAPPRLKQLHSDVAAALEAYHIGSQRQPQVRPQPPVQQPDSSVAIATFGGAANPPGSRGATPSPPPPPVPGPFGGAFYVPNLTLQVGPFGGAGGSGSGSAIPGLAAGPFGASAAVQHPAPTPATFGYLLQQNSNGSGFRAATAAVAASAGAGPAVKPETFPAVVGPVGLSSTSILSVHGSESLRLIHQHNHNHNGGGSDAVGVGGGGGGDAGGSQSGGSIGIFASLLGPPDGDNSLLDLGAGLGLAHGGTGGGGGGASVMSWSRGGGSLDVVSPSGSGGRVEDGGGGGDEGPIDNGGGEVTDMVRTALR